MAEHVIGAEQSGKITALYAQFHLRDSFSPLRSRSDYLPLRSHSLLPGLLAVTEPTETEISVRRNTMSLQF